MLKADTQLGLYTILPQLGAGRLNYPNILIVDDVRYVLTGVSRREKALTPRARTA
jgi:hypothetical protein